ncbi:MAG: ABC transporter substrate-binding protein [Deltaproteobacteria bacterium]|jgi:putative ABC transport system substrate-binding protein|nr:ABC transporter substrate-binding protein [Deltaproteobacteria bacterium]
MSRLNFVFVATLALALLAGPAVVLSAQEYVISVNQFTEHPTLNDAVKGFKDQLLESGLKVTYKEHNAKNDLAALGGIVEAMAAEKPNLVLAVATPSAQATYRAIKDIPLVFMAVTDPVTSGLVPSLAPPHANVTGTTDMTSVAEQLLTVLEIQPDLKNLGVIYNPKEINSSVEVNLAKMMEKSLGISIIDGVAETAGDVSGAARSLVGKVDAFYLPRDNTVIGALPAIEKVSSDNKIPIYAADSDTIRKGGVASLTIDYYELGRQTGRIAAKILKDGVPAESIPVEKQVAHDLIVNTAYATSIGLAIPESVLAKATENITK